MFTPEHDEKMTRLAELAAREIAVAGDAEIALTAFLAAVVSCTGRRSNLGRREQLLSFVSAAITFTNVSMEMDRALESDEPAIPCAHCGREFIPSDDTVLAPTADRGAILAYCDACGSEPAHHDRDQRAADEQQPTDGQGDDHERQQ